MPARRMSMQLATILEASPPPRSPRNARRLSLGVNIPVDQRPPRRLDRGLTDSSNSAHSAEGPVLPRLNSLAFSHNTPVKTNWRRQSVGAMEPVVSHKALNRRQSLPCRAKESARRRSIAAVPASRSAPAAPAASSLSKIPSYARPTAASLRRRKTPT